MTETNVEYRILTSHVCWDGLARTSHVIQVRINDGRWTNEGSEFQRKGAAIGAMGDKVRAFNAQDGFVACTMDDEVSYSHRHIGEYGSPRLFRCTTLDRL